MFYTYVQKKHKKLNQYLATAICGNDILSSALYVSGIAIVFTGVYAPLILLFIAGVLFLYKKIYTEVVEALPVNGGAYNCLLNGTSKNMAAIAGIATFLSYVATAVISAKVGIEYLHTIIPSLPVISGTIVLLFIFALLVISGLKDSAKVAFGIFSIHILTLTLFLIYGAFHYLTGQTNFFADNLMHTKDIILSKGSLLTTLYLGFSACLLGVSGFESSANFVEEQDKGVFRKTLRNMLIGVTIFNPLIALIVLNSMPFDAISSAKDFLLSDAAYSLGGSILRYVVVIDAFMVLSGAVLTAYVGVSGLISRMASDNCLPIFFDKKNSKGSFPRIVIFFLLLCSSILLITKGNLLSLAGVYTIAFLSVMSLFAFGNLILKETRPELKRTYNAPIWAVVIAFFATTIGIFGNIRIDLGNLKYFEIYFLPTLFLVILVLYQVKIIKFLIRISTPFKSIQNKIEKIFRNVIKDETIVFISDVSRLYPILNYVRSNEPGWNIKLVHCLPASGRDHVSTTNEIEEALMHLKKANVFPHLNITLKTINEPFSPEVIEKVAREFEVQKNKIFIGSLHHSHDFDYSDVGGVRIIFE